MNKILVEIFVPSIETSYDVFIPISKKVKEVTRLIIKAINELSDGYYPINSDPIIYDRKTGKEINKELTVKESGLKNDSEIVIY